MLGTILDKRYKIISQLGRGYYGETYLAEDVRRMGRQCVVKRLRPASNDLDMLREAKRLFDSEAKTLEKLGREHDQSPDLLDYFEENREFYLVQELVEGHPLSTVISDTQRLSEAEVSDILLDVLEVLTFVHQCQVIHRDIKPSNLMRRYKDGKIVLIDFGVIKQVHTQFINGQGQTAFSRVIGTPGYIPNEQARGKPRFNSDIYALGMTAIEALTGVPPSELQEDSHGEVIWHKQAIVSPQLAAILDKMVLSHFRDRYQSAEEVLHDLRKLQVFDDSNKIHVSPRRKRRRTVKLKHILLAIGAIFLLGLVGTQICGYALYSVFPSQPISVINSLPSSRFLQRSLLGLSHNLHAIAISQALPNFANFNSVSTSPDGQIFASGSGDGIIKLWNLETGKLLATLTAHSGHIHALAISPDGQILASGSGDGTVKLWNLHTGKLLRTLTGHSRHVNSVAISQDGQTLVSGSDGETIELWNLETGKLLRTLTGHSGNVNCVAISQDGQTLVSGNGGGTIELWNLGTGQLLHTLIGASSVFYVAISPDGQTLFSSNGARTIKLWNLETGKLIRTLTGYSSVVTTVALSPDGKTLASDSGDQTIKLWNLGTGEVLLTLTGYIVGGSEYVNSVAFSPDGQTLVNGTGDGTINIWHVPGR